MAGRRKSYDDLLTGCEQKIVRDVAVHFLSEKQATPHKRLVLAHRDPDAVIRLARYGLMSQPQGQQYLPTALGFQLSGDRMARRRARASFELVLRVLSKLFESEDLKSQFDVSEINGLASKMFEGISPDDIWLGLYLASEFRIFNQWSGSPFDIKSVTISDHIVTIPDIATEWDKHIEARVVYLEQASAPGRRELFLRNLITFSGDNHRAITTMQVHRAATEAGFQHDEIRKLIRDCDALGFVRSNAKSDTIRLTKTGLQVVRPSAAPQTSRNEAAAHSRKVFIVHGHDEAVKQTVARFMERLELSPIILSEQPNKGRTIIEKFEEHSDVGFAVVLLTPDDFGGPASDRSKVSPRARQNVILELGYFLARLGRNRVCALLLGKVETPSDIDGVIYIEYDRGGGWRLHLANEIQAAGIDVDLNRAAYKS